MEIRKVAAVYITEFKCDVCGIGSMKPTGVVHTGQMNQYEHKCDNTLCDTRKNFFKKYPIIDYE